MWWYPIRTLGRHLASGIQPMYLLSVVPDPNSGLLDWAPPCQWRPAHFLQYEPEDFEALLKRLCGPEEEVDEESEDEELDSDEPESESEGDEPGSEGIGSGSENESEIDHPGPVQPAVDGMCDKGLRRKDSAICAARS
ncbi:hypothetical protein B0H14DRAFT_2598608 [Mycena olivaceomarginata]|nr:hypothetical protein B0H14DRAFT_2598608 [Mycena olivaceomarginata]